MNEVSRQPLPLCRQDNHTCGACCWGEQVGRSRLRQQLRRQRRLFHGRFPSGHLPDRWQLLRYELAARRALDLFLAVLLWLPGVGDWLRPRLRRRLVCAYLAFEDKAERRIGCLLHPSRWDGVEVRPRVAFRLLAGFGCGAPDFYCLAARWFAAATWEERRDFAARTAALDWYAFSKAAAGYRPAGNKAGPRALPARHL